MHPDTPIDLTLPLPPGINQQYVTLKNGRRGLSENSKKWKKVAGQEIALYRFDGRISDAFVAQAQQGYLAVSFEFYFESPLRRDLDGGLKILLDTLCGALGVDDNRVVDIHLSKRIDPLRPRVAVQIEALPTWKFDDDYTYLGPPPSSHPA
jgi:crossover junction endodeoxyribonuclease RusA